MYEIVTVPGRGRHLKKVRHVPMQNGILDLDSWLGGGHSDDVLYPHDGSKWFNFYVLPYDFDPLADCPKWKATLKHNQEDDIDRMNLLQEWAGYLLFPDTSQQKFLILEGEGSNGKSVYCAGIEGMLGTDAVSHVQLEIFHQRFALTETLEKMVNICTDTGEVNKVCEGLLKSFVSGDRMFFDRKGKPGINAKPTARLMTVWNNRPRFVDRSSGLWRRMMVVPWGRTIKESDPGFVRGMDDPTWWERSGELPGIFNWAVVGLKRLRAQGRFTKSEVSQQAIEEYKSESNPARQFLEDGYEEAPSDIRTPSPEVYRAYKLWCTENCYSPLGERSFGKEVKRAFPNSIRKQFQEHKKREWNYYGVMIQKEI